MTKPPNFIGALAKIGALKAIEAGQPVIPLKPMSKKPAIKDWPNQASVKEEDVRALFKDCPTANYGVLTGSTANLLVLDVDRAAGVRSIGELIKQLGPLPPTVKVRTRRGYHLYFRHPGGNVPTSAGTLGDGFDVRADGGYVVGAGCVHPAGGRYRFSEGHSFSDIPIAALPKTWATHLQDHAGEAAGPGLKDAQSKVIPEGQRNIYLTSVAGGFASLSRPSTTWMDVLVLLFKTRSFVLADQWSAG